MDFSRGQTSRKSHVTRFAEVRTTKQETRRFVFLSLRHFGMGKPVLGY